METSRRDSLKVLAGAGMAMALSNTLAAATAQADPAPADTKPPAYRGTNEIKPLPFDAAKLKGISEKLITSHHQNNYSGAVKRLNQIQQQIGALAKDAPPFQLGALKREELIATNSMMLHDLYFANLGGPTATPDGTIANLIKAEYGSLETWESEFRTTGQALGGGSGWVVLNYNPRNGAVHTYWSGEHTQNLAWGTPLLVMDMYEHAYQMDYGADAKSYINAFFQNINWVEANRRAEGVHAPGKA